MSLLLTISVTVFSQSPSDGFATSLDSYANRVVSDVQYIYFSGPTLTTVNGVSRNKLARISRGGGLDTTYNPNPIGTVNDILIVGQKLMVLGGFSSIGGAASGGIARLNFDGTNDGAFTSSLSGPNTVAYEQSTGRVVVGGSFLTVDGNSRARLARFNANGTLDPNFAPIVNNTVFDVEVQPDGKILIAGQFTQVNGVDRWRLARLNSDGTLDTTFQVNAAYPGAGDSIFTLTLQPDGKILAGGAFTRFGDINIVRNHLVRLNPNGGIETAYNPSFDGNVLSVRMQSDGRSVVSGTFTTLNGASHANIARVNLDGSRDASFTSSANTTVHDTTILTNNEIVAVGEFTTFNGFPNINRIASLYPNGRLNQDTNTTILGGPPAAMLSLPDGMTLIGGGFTSVGGTTRQGLARVAWTGANDSTFVNPQLTGWVYDLAVLPNGQYLAGGDFTTAGGTSQARLARINTNGTVDGSFAPTFTSSSTPYIGAIAVQPDGNILIGGEFATVNGIAKTRIARLLPSGSIDTTFGTTLDFSVGCIALQSDGKILIGGAFGNVNGQARVGLVRLNANGTTDTTFNPVLNGIVAEVLDIKIDKNGKILVGGTFAGVNGNGRPNLVRLNSDGTNDATFTAATIDGAVHNIAETVIGNIYISGNFDNVNGQPHSKLTMLASTGAVDNSFVNMPFTDKILAMTMRDDGKVIVGGYFTSVGGQSRGQFAAIRYFQPPIYAFTYNSSSLTWYRWWWVPEVSRVTFERSTDGINYSSIGSGSRSAANWVLNVQNASANGFIRTRGYYGDYSTGGSFTERIQFVSTAPRRSGPFDFDGDLKTDIGIFRPGPGEWWYQRSSDSQVPALQFGSSTDVIVPSDFTGDGKTDIAFWRPSTGYWFVLRSEDYSFFSVPFGTTNDVPVPGDYDADGKADLAVFRPSSVTWFINNSGGGTDIITFGTAGDIPVPGDFDGDGKADIAIYRPNGASGSEWWLRRSSTGTTFATQFGTPADRAVPGDFTGDGKTDIAFWRPSNGSWFVLRSEDLSFFSFPFGANGDTPVPGDYDGDGKWDAGVFRPSNSTWFVQRSTAGTLIQQFGNTGDIPLASAYVR